MNTSPCGEMPHPETWRQWSFRTTWPVVLDRDSVPDLKIATQRLGRGSCVWLTPCVLARKNGQSISGREKEMMRSDEIRWDDIHKNAWTYYSCERMRWSPLWLHWSLRWTASACTLHWTGWAQGPLCRTELLAAGPCYCLLWQGRKEQCQNTMS